MITNDVSPGDDILASQYNDLRKDVYDAAPIGTLKIWTKTTAPDGWLLCDGAAYNAAVDTEYQDLYDIIGNVFGGADNTDFEVPDMRGNLPLGKDDMGGSSRNRVTNAAADTIGSEQGAETHTLVIGEIPSHSHNINLHNAGGTTSNTQGAGTNDVGNVSTDAAGGGGAHNNMPPYMTFAYIIKY